MSLHHTENAPKLGARCLPAFKQSLDVTAQDRQWRAQFVGNVGDEIAAHNVEPFQFGNVVKQNNRAADAAILVAHRNGVHLQMALANQDFALGWLPLFQGGAKSRSEEHTSELQSHSDLVCRL